MRQSFPALASTPHNADLWTMKHWEFTSVLCYGIAAACTPASISPAAKQRHKHASKPSLIVLPSATTKVLGGNSGPHFSSSAHVSNLTLLFFLETLLPGDVQHADKLMCYFFALPWHSDSLRIKTLFFISSSLFLLSLAPDPCLSGCLSAYILAHLPVCLSFVCLSAYIYPSMFYHLWLSS